MNFNKKLLAVLIASSTLLGGCSDDDDPSNRAPVVQNIQLGSGDSFTLVTISRDKILAAASDPDGDALSITSFTTSGAGTLAETETGWSYQPAEGEIGDVAFSFSISDGKKSASASATLSLLDKSEVAVSEHGMVTVTGSLKDALTRQYVGNLDVAMWINGQKHHGKTSADGSATFSGLPTDTEYLIKISDPNGKYASVFYSDTTPSPMYIVDDKGTPADTSDDTQTEVAQTQVAGIGSIYQGKEASITVMDITTGEAISGLSLYYDADSVAYGNPVSVDFEDELATEENGVYKFFLPNDNNSVAIEVTRLMNIDGEEYQPYRTDMVGNTVGNLKAGEMLTYYVHSNDPTEFTIIYNLVDENGEAFDAGNVLPIVNDSKGYTEYWSRVVDTTNQYQYQVTKSNMSDLRIIAPWDADGDGFEDYTVNGIYSDEAHGFYNPITRGSFDENKHLTIVYPVHEIDYTDNVQAQVISKEKNFRAGVSAKMIVSFDRPVSLLHAPKLRTHSMMTEQTLVSLGTADLYEKDMTTIATAEVDNGNATFLFPTSTTDSNGNVSVSYNYTNDTVSPTVNASFTPSGQDANGRVVSPYVTKFVSESNVTALQETEYELSANNSLLTITLDPNSIEAYKTYEVEIVVAANIGDNPTGSLTVSYTAQGNSTPELFVDNFDYHDTTVYDPTKYVSPADVIADPTKTEGNTTYSVLANQAFHQSKFATLSMLYVGGAATDRALIEYMPYNIVLAGFSQVPSFTTPLVDAAGNMANPTTFNPNIYLVSKARLDGVIQLISQEEVDAEGVTTTENLIDSSYRVGNVSTNVTGPELSSLTAITTNTRYLLDKPYNHGIDGTGIASVYGVSAVSGAKISSEGVYYIYQLPITRKSDGFVKSVNLSFSGMVNGVNTTIASTAYPVN